MANQTEQQETTPITAKADERILVIKRELLLPNSGWHGIKEVNFGSYLQTIDQHKQFLWRSQMEEDITYKQIIPYLVFTYQDSYFLMQRQSTASEKRLRSKYSLGIGGHIRQEDMGSNSIFDWAKREFYEEVNYSGSLTIKPLGILNDDSNTVGQVHLGFVLLLEGDSEQISVKSELKSGFLASIDQCQEQFELMESWSQLVFSFINSKMKP